MQRCSWTCVPSPVSKSQNDSRTRSASDDALRKGDGLHAPLPSTVSSTSAPLLPWSLSMCAAPGCALAAGGGGGGGGARGGAVRLLGCPGVEASSRWREVRSASPLSRAWAVAPLATAVGAWSGSGAGAVTPSWLRSVRTALLAPRSERSASTRRGASSALVPVTRSERRAHSDFS